MFEILSAEKLVATAVKAPPGPQLLTALAALAALDVDRLDPDVHVAMLVALERHAAWLCGLMQPLYAAVGEHAEAEARQHGMNRHDAARAAHSEIETALRLSEAGAGTRLWVAQKLCGPLSAVRQALLSGDLSFAHAAAIVDATSSLSDEQAATVAGRVLHRAGKRRWCSCAAACAGR